VIDKRFSGNFTQQEPIPEDGIAAAVDVMRSGRIHRYNLLPGEDSQASLLEREFAAYQGSRYCLACASGGTAMQIALRAVGAKQGEVVLTNAFTLAPVPGAIHAVGARPVLVEITEDLVLDIDDLAEKADDTGAKVLLLSLMRGHLPDMERLLTVADAAGLTVIEDCAHTMGATWNGCKSGSFGKVGCFSTQTYKHMNSGEGGFLVTDDEEVIARAIILSGSYMLYGRHGAAPGQEAFEAARYEMPNTSSRMDNMRAAMLRPQLAGLDANVKRWNERYDRVAGALRKSNVIRLPQRPPQEGYVGSSIQFAIPGISPDTARGFVAATGARGVDLKWFGANEPVAFTSNHHSWRYVAPQKLPATDRILSCLFDMRLPLTFSLADCVLIGDIILEEANKLGRESTA
jgi:dTDP-4-amino-4,6-dideoxygalactose transaminase